MSKKRKLKRRDDEIRNLIAKDNRKWLFPGRYYGWEMSSLTSDYLEWVVANVVEKEFRDQAECELFLRKADK